jgi:hypothetical protein
MGRLTGNGIICTFVVEYIPIGKRYLGYPRKKIWGEEVYFVRP